MNNLSSLDFLLTLGGNRLNGRMFGCRKLGSISNLVSRILIAMSAIYIIRGCLIWTSDGARQRLYVMTTIITIAIAMGIMVLFAARRERITRLMKCITDADSTGKEINNLGYFAMGVLFFGFTCQLYGLYTIMSHYVDEQTAALVVLLMFPYFLNQYVVIYPTLYVSFLTVLTRRETDRLQMFCHIIRKAGHLEIQNVIVELEQIMAYKQEFENLFNIIPCLQFGILFVTVPGVTVTLYNDSIRGLPYVGQEILVYIAIHSCIFVFLLLIVDRVDKARREVSQTTALLIHYIHSRHSYDLYTSGFKSLIDELRINEAFKFTGWNMFTIDKSILLSFLSAIITFSVLLIQLASGN